MQIVIWSGAALSFAGLIGLVYCIVAAMKIRKSAQDDEALRAKLQRLIPVNFGSLLLSILGLCVVITGISLS